MPRYSFHLSISPKEFLRYYQWDANSVRVLDDQGRSIRFPAMALREYVTHQGIHGRFCLETDDHHRLVRLTRID